MEYVCNTLDEAMKVFSSHTTGQGDIFFCSEEVFNLLINRPERLSERTYYRNDDGTYPPLEPVIGSDSLNTANI